ncbi:choice-of-anchor tandem repeat GloVer-containing protein, partial [Candidatus Auribacterota bacterium]
FRIDTAGGDFTLLHEFVGGGSDGSMPYGDLLLSGSNMYGMTYWGGDLDRGTIFMIGVDGSGFTLLHELAGGADDGRKPRGSLALSEGVLYGVSEYGGDSNFGALFQINTDGTGFTMLHDFVGGANDGTFPDYVTLNILENKLYGTASGGGDSDYGVIFSFATSEGEVPEPSTLLLLLPFILGLRWMIKKKKMLMILLCLFVTLSLCITTSPANALDLDDAYPDIVFGNFNGPEGYVSNSVVYWGDSSRASSFATYKQLNTRGAMGTAVADVNQDEKLDVVLSNYSEGAPLHRNINSYVYWGETLTSRKELDTYGAKGVSVGDINDDGYYDIVYSNYQAASSFEHNSYVYWGDSSSSYPSKTLLATKGAVGNKIVDLNEDGYLDVIFANYVDNVSRNTLSTIYWGPGPAFASSTNFATSGARDVSVADLNNDDYLDLVISGYHNDTTHAMNSKIYWGDSSYLYASGMDLPTVGAMGNSVGDLNKDGYLDIVFSNHKTDANNYLINSYIYWGAESNPYTSKTELATVGADGNAIGDIDKDGYVDIVFANFTNGTSRQINSYIYWGDESCTYASKTELLTGGAEGVTIVGGNVSTGVSAYGNVVPMWFTQNDYDSGVLDSWQYSFIGTQYELLNSGALDFSDEEIYQLAELYFNQTGSVEIDGITWTYFSETIGGHDTPEAWYDSSTYYFQMGSGLEGEGGGGGEVPEPSTLLLLLPFLAGFGWWYRRRK